MTARESERIAAELAALGEEPAGYDELSFSAAGGEPGQAGDEALCTVAALAAWSRPLPPELTAPISELSLRRVGARVQASLREHAAAAVGSRRSIVTTLVVVAAAASVLLVPRLRDPGVALDEAARQELRSELQATGEAIRQGVDALGPHGSERARGLADAYARRLRDGAGAGEGGGR